MELGKRNGQAARRTTGLSSGRIPRVPFLAGAALLACALSITSGGGAQAKPLPKTVFQCQKVFKHSASKRAACIRRVKSEKPGANCQHPIMSGTNGVEHFGDHKEFTVDVHGVDPNHPVEKEQSIWMKVTLHTSRLVLCPKAELEVDVVTAAELLGQVPLNTQHRIFHVSIPPTGGESSSVKTAVDGYAGRAFARIK